MHIQDMLREYFTNAKGAKRTVAEFFITNFNDIPMLTLDEVSLKTGVSLSTVTRTTSEMGFHGFPDFQKQVWASLKTRLAPSVRMGLSAPSTPQTPNESFQYDIKNVVQASNLNQESAFDEASAMIAEAAKVYILGVRTASTLSSFFFYGLSKIRPSVYSLDNSDTCLEHFGEVSGDSVLFAASFPRYTKRTVATAQEICSRGGRVISLTDSPSSPLVPYSKTVLYAPYESVSFFNSMVAPLSILNVLIVKINAILGSAGERHLVQYEKLMDRWGVLVESQSKLKK